MGPLPEKTTLGNYEKFKQEELDLLIKTIDQEKKDE